MIKSVFYFILYASTTTLAQWFSHSPLSQPCSFSQWQCFDGSCISNDGVCDGFHDCPDGSDESSYTCGQRRCPWNSIRCDGSCLNVKYICNGEKDCSNGLDEADEICKRTPECFALPQVKNGFVSIGSFEKEHFDPSLPNGKKVNRKYRVKCQSGYSLGSGDLACVNGSWVGKVPSCIKCGDVTPGPRRMSTEGDSYQYGIAPWHVGIYNKLKKPYKLACGGSLITAMHIITAAQCFWDDAIGILPAPIFAVAVGKAYSDWDDERDYTAQSNDVDEINVPELFNGETDKQMHNIAFVTVASSFEFTKFVKPVCIDFGSLFTHQGSQKDNSASVWSPSSSNKPYQIADAYIVDRCESAKTFTVDFLQYITEDKICIIYNGPAVSPEVAGSGLVYTKESFGETLTYLEGVASVGKQQPHSALIFTDILYHQKFLEKYLNF